MNPKNVHPSVEHIENGKAVKYFDSDVYNEVPTMLRMMAGYNL